MITMSPFDCTKLQQEEFETLSAIYNEDVKVLNDANTCFVVDIKFLTDDIKKEDVIKVWFRYVFDCVLLTVLKSVLRRLCNSVYKVHTITRYSALTTRYITITHYSDHQPL